MAFKRDTFWEDHPPLVPEQPGQSGVRLVEEVDQAQIGYLIVTPLVSVIIVATVGLWGPGWQDRVFFLLFIVLSLLFVTWPGLVNGKRLYRFCDESSTASGLGNRSGVLPELQRTIVKSESLWERLGPPDPHSLRPFDLRSAFPTITAMLPIYLMGGMAVMFSPTRLVALSVFPYTLDTVIWLATLALFVLPLLLLWLAYRRICIGVHILGTGDEKMDGDQVSAHFDEISAAELHWDRWLGKPYILLELYDVRIRYYSICDDPLHLLRLAKYHMPHLKLRA